jgi:hypothetical protein
MPVSTLNLQPEEILKLEFEYARETAAQAQNDRTAVVNLYLLLVGGVGSIGIALPQLGPRSGFDVPRSGYALMFMLLGLIGFFTVMKLVRLRQSWYESVHAMNTIKKFYIDRFPEVNAAFDWQVGSIPALGKPWTITFNLSLMVALVDCAAIAVGFHFADQYLANPDMVGVFAAVLFLLWQIYFYFFQLPLSNN